METGTRNRGGRPRREFSASERARIRSLVSARVALDEIARRFRMSRNTLARLLKEIQPP